MKKKKKKTTTKPKLFQTALTAFILILVVLLIKQLRLQPDGSSSVNKKGADTEGVEKIEISGVIINDFFKNSSSPDTESYTSITRTKDYHVFYFPPDELFVISITSYPFDQHRPVAEQELLKSLGITEEEACKLNVDTTTPSFANPDKAGEIYDLSFCSNNN